MPLPCSRRCLLASLTFLLAPLWMAALSPEESQRLAAGEVLVELRTVRPGAPKEGIGRGVIAAPPERVFRALTDYQHFDEFMPFVESSDAAPQPDGSVLSFQRLDLPAPIGDRFYKIRGRAAIEGSGRGRVWRTRWSYVPGSGNVAGHHGSWSLVEISPGRTLATCRLYTDPGGAVPGWAMDRATRRSLPWIFDGLRQQIRRGRYN